MANYYLTEDPRLNVSRGLVKGAQHVHVLGYNPDIDIGTDPETVWATGGEYPWDTMSSANTIYYVSNNAADTMQVVVVGLDNDHNVVQETITLSGTTPVAGAVKLLRINDAYIYGSANRGTINMHFANTTGTIVDSMLAGYGQNTTGIYSIPAGKTGYLYAGDASTGLNKEVTVVFRIRLHDGGLRVAHIAELSNGSYRYDFHFPAALPEKSDLEVYVINTLDNNTRIACNFDLLLVDTPIR